jgi:preprotein translocase subunit YajC
MLHAIVLLAQEKGQQGEPSNPLTMLAPLLIIVLLFFFMIILPQRRERRVREEMMSRLKKNDRVITNAGIFGHVVNIKDNEVTLRIDETSNARMTVLRSSIAQILSAEDQSAKDADKTSEAIKK